MPEPKIALVLAPIRPCPFCGEHEALRVNDDDEVFRYVSCLACGAHGPVHGPEDDDPELGKAYMTAAERDAINAWNGAKRDA